MTAALSFQCSRLDWSSRACRRAESARDGLIAGGYRGAPRLRVSAQAKDPESNKQGPQASEPVRAPPLPPPPRVLGPADVRRDTAHILANQTSPDAVEEATRQKFLGRLAVVLFGVCSAGSHNFPKSCCHFKYVIGSAQSASCTCGLRS